MGIVGAGAGFLLGTFAPEYYRSILRTGRERSFEPRSVGLGLGLGQGLSGGAVIGVGLVAFACWREERERVAVANSGASSAPSPSAARWLLKLAAAVLLVVLGFGVGAFVGVNAGAASYMRYRNRVEEWGIRSALERDPSFGRLDVHYDSNGDFYLTGDVPTREDFERLRSVLIRAAGEHRMRNSLSRVDVR